MSLINYTKKSREIKMPVNCMFEHLCHFKRAAFLSIKCIDVSQHNIRHPLIIVLEKVSVDNFVFNLIPRFDDLLGE